MIAGLASSSSVAVCEVPSVGKLTQSGSGPHSDTGTLIGVREISVCSLSSKVRAAVEETVRMLHPVHHGSLMLQSSLMAVDTAFKSQDVLLGEAAALEWAEQFVFDPGIGSRDFSLLQAAGSLEAMQRLQRTVCTRPGLTAERFGKFDDRFGQVLDPHARRVLRSFAIDGVPTLRSPEFTPNRKPPKPRAKYLRIHPAYHKNIAEMHEKGVVWLFPSKELNTFVNGDLHYNANHWVLKGGCPAGRSIQDTSAAEEGSWPLNHDGVKEMAELQWGRLMHPTIIELVTQVVLRAKREFVTELGAGETLVLWKMDLKGAFNLLQVEPASVHLWAFELLGDLTMIFPVGCFGWTNYPHAFGTITTCLEAAVATVIRGFSKAYVDDFMGCCLLKDVHHDMQAAKDVFCMLLGDGSVADNKSVHGLALTWIGWEVELRETYVLGIGKALLLKALYVFYSADSTATSRRELEKLASYAARFSLIYTFLKPFVGALYAEYGHRDRHVTFPMSKACVMAVETWRYFLIEAQLRPTVFSRSLTSFASKHIAATIVWDASLYGIGAVLFAGDGVSGSVLRVLKVPLSAESFPFGQDSQYQNLAEYLGVTLGIAVLVRSGFTRCGIRIIGDSVTALQWTVEGTFVQGPHDRAAVMQALLRTDNEISVEQRDWLSGEQNHFCDNLSRQTDPFFNVADVSLACSPHLLCTTETDPWIEELLCLLSPWTETDSEWQGAHLLRDATRLSQFLSSLGKEACVRSKLSDRVSSSFHQSKGEEVWRPDIQIDDLVELQVSAAFDNIPKTSFPRISRHTTVETLFEVIGTGFGVPPTVLSLRTRHPRRVLSMQRDARKPISSLVPLLAEVIEVEWYGQLLGGMPTLLSEEEEVLVETTLRGAVLPGTGNSYERGWRYWLEFLAPRQIRPDPYLTEDALQRRVQLLALFWRYLRCERGLTDPGPLFSGVRHCFRAKQIDLAMFEHESVRTTKIALRETARESSVHRLTGTGSRRLRNVPSSDFLPTIRRWAFDVPRDELLRARTIRTRFCTYVASACMFNFGLRSINVCTDTTRGSCQHALRFSDVSFKLEGDNWLSCPVFAEWFQTERRSQTLLVCLGKVSQARLFFHSSKIHRTIGVTEYVCRRTHAEAQLLEDLAWWVAQGCEVDIADPTLALFARGFTSNDSRGQPRHFVRFCRRSDINEAIRVAAVSLGFPPELYSSRSWRVAAATVMRSAGHAEEAIRSMGNWSSSASYLYQRNEGGEPRPLCIR